MEKKEEKKKLTYEQLQAYASQMSDQANRLFKENQALRKSVNDSARAFGLKEIECALKCIELKESFSKEFIEKVVARVEEILDPDAKEGKDNEQPESE